MAIGESIKKGFSVTKSSWGLVGIFFAYGALTNILNLQLSERLRNNQGDSQAGGAALMIGGTISILTLLFGIFLQAGSIGYVRDKIKQGTASLSNFPAYGKRYYLRLLAFGVIVSLIILVIALIGTALITLMPESMKLVGAIITILVAVIGLYLIVLMFLAPYVIVNEDEKTIPAVKRSTWLVQRHILSVLGIGLILIAVGFLLGLLSGIILGVVSAALRNSTVAPYITSVFSAFVNSFLGVFMTATYFTLYLRLKASEENSIPAAAAV